MHKIGLIATSRGRYNRKKSFEAMRDLTQVLREHEVVQFWIDEHGYWWKKDTVNQTIVPIAGGYKLINDRVIIIDQDVNNSIGSEKIDLWIPLFDGCDYVESGISSVLDWTGVMTLGAGTRSNLVFSDNELAKKIFSSWPFRSDQKIIIQREEWLDQNWDTNEGILGKISFPVLIRYNDVFEKVLYPMNLMTVLARVFEEDIPDEVEIESIHEAEKLVVAVVGRKNYLPSRVMKITDDNNIEIWSDSQAKGREMQDIIMHLTREGWLQDFGLIYFCNETDGWKIEKVVPYPALDRQGVWARCFENSGLGYNDIIKRIVLETKDNM